MRDFSMYNVFLSLHNIFRWAVLAIAVWTVFRFLSGFIGKRAFTDGDANARKWFTIALDIQFTLGLILMFLSPFVAAFFDHPGGVMGDSRSRLLGFEHWLTMLIAVVLAHVGAGKSKKATDDVSKFKYGAIFFTIAVVLILARIPWFQPMLRMFE